jgi:hypothetical protein
VKDPIPGRRRRTVLLCCRGRLGQLDQRLARQPELAGLLQQPDQLRQQLGGLGVFARGAVQLAEALQGLDPRGVQLDGRGVVGGAVRQPLEGEARLAGHKVARVHAVDLERLRASMQHGLVVARFQGGLRLFQEPVASLPVHHRPECRLLQKFVRRTTSWSITRKVDGWMDGGSTPLALVRVLLQYWRIE